MTKTFTRENALSLYPNSNEKGKKILEEIFGEQTFQWDPIRDCNSLEDACRYNGTDINQVIPWKDPIDGDQRSTNAYSSFIQIYRAFNHGVVPEWGPGTPYKYSAWVNMPTPSGVGLSFLAAVCDARMRLSRPALLFSIKNWSRSYLTASLN